LYPDLRARGDRLRNGITQVLRNAGYAVVTSGDGPVFQVSFMPEPAKNYRDTLHAQSSLYSDFALGLLAQGVLVLPDGRWYVSTAHTDDDIDRTLEIVRTVCHSG
jgi:glutamate-1-semialdehyde 2,1-aminomutase